MNRSRVPSPLIGVVALAARVPRVSSAGPDDGKGMSLGEQPRILFLHDAGVGKSADLVGAVAAALKETKQDNTP